MYDGKDSAMISCGEFLEVTLYQKGRSDCLGPSVLRGNYAFSLTQMGLLQANRPSVRRTRRY